MEPQTKTKILLLDDEHFLLEMYRIVFERSECDVRTFDSADDAVGALRAGYDPDLILFDVTMPDGRSGYEFLEMLAGEKLGGRSMKIALTNEGQDAEIERLGELGADAHMLKAAYIPSQLASIALESLQKWRLQKK